MRRTRLFITFLFVALVLLPTVALAVPQIMSYQGKLNDKTGVPVNGSVTMTFTIYDAPTGGNVLWTETWTSVNVSNGIFNVALGSVTPFPSTLFNSDTLYLGIRVGTTDAEMTPRQRITSGSYAFKAATVEYNVPIGTIVAWAKDLTGVPALPDGWVECNGQQLVDAQSPLNNQIIPNLNGNNYFLRGSTTSNGTGGSATHTHSVPMDGWGSGGANGVTGRLVVTYGTMGLATVDNTTGPGSSIPPYHNVVWIMKVK